MTEEDKAWLARYALARRMNLALLGVIPARAADGDAFASTLFDDLPAKREGFQDALYRVAQAARPSSHDIDALLDAHRQAYGDPEQAAYARQPDPCDLRLPRVEDPDVAMGKVARYLEEHRSWTR